MNYTITNGQCSKCINKNDQLNENKKCLTKKEECKHPNEKQCLECIDGRIMEERACK